MKINKPSSSAYKKTLLTIGVVLVVAIVYGVYAKSSQLWPFTDKTTTSQEKSTDTPQEESPPQPANNLPESDEESTETENSAKTPVQNEEDDSPSKVRASITAANQNGSTLQIRTLIETVSTKGTCVLTLEKDDKKVVRTAGIQALANSSTCKGFNEPVSNLSAGAWDATIDISLPSGKIQLTKKISIK